MINDDLLIDLGPDLMSACFAHGKSTDTIRHLLQTHSHSDHFDPQILTTRIPEYIPFDTPELHLYASKKTLAKMSAMVRAEGYVDDFLEPAAQKRMNLKVFPVEPLQSFEIAAYKVIAFTTNHDPSVEPLSYVIIDHGFTLYYCTDTDVLPEETWAGFHTNDLKFDVVALDHTYGPGADSGGHLNAERFVEQIERMRKERLLAEGARILATHISHEGNPPHEEFSKYAANFGYEVAYDGLVI